MTARELASILSISPKTIYSYVAERNMIPHFKIEATATSTLAGCVQTSPGGVTWIRSTEVPLFAVRCTENIS